MQLEMLPMKDLVYAIIYLAQHNTDLNYIRCVTNIFTECEDFIWGIRLKHVIVGTIPFVEQLYLFGGVCCQIQWLHIQH